MTRVASFVVSLGLLLVAGVAFADPTADRVETEKILASLTAQGKSAEMVAPQVTSAREALERANGARNAHDLPHAEQLEHLARLRAEGARQLLEATQLEQKAAEAQKNAEEARKQVQQSRLQLEASAAKLGEVQSALAHAKEERAHKLPVPLSKVNGQEKSGKTHLNEDSGGEPSHASKGSTSRHSAPSASDKGPPSAPAPPSGAAPSHVTPASPKGQ